MPHNRPVRRRVVSLTGTFKPRSNYARTLKGFLFGENWRNGARFYNFSFAGEVDYRERVANIVRTVFFLP